MRSLWISSYVKGLAIILPENAYAHQRPWHGPKQPQRKRAAAVLADNARKAAALPMEIFFAGMTGNNEVVFEWCVARTVSAGAHLFGLTC